MMTAAKDRKFKAIVVYRLTISAATSATFPA